MNEEAKPTLKSPISETETIPSKSTRISESDNTPKEDMSLIEELEFMISELTEQKIQLSNQIDGYNKFVLPISLTAEQL